MSELTRETLEAVREHYTRYEPDGLVVSAVDMALRIHDAEQEAAHWKRETEREAYRANEWEKEADKMVHHAFRHQDRADRAESERDEVRKEYDDLFDEADKIRRQRDEARQEAARLREAVLVGLGAAKFCNMSQEVIDKMTEVLQSAPPASELPGNDMETLTCACGMPSVYESGDCLACGAVGNSPAPAPRPEPSEAMDAFDRFLYDASIGQYPLQADVLRIRRALSQPAPAVPDAVRQLQYYVNNPSAWEDGFSQNVSDAIERALATHPADGDSPAVPETDAQREALEAWERLLLGKEDARDRDVIGEVLAQSGQAVPGDKNHEQ